MHRRQSPIFVKTYDLVLWLLERVERFPKGQRFVLGRRVEDKALELQDLLVAAVHGASPARTLRLADVALHQLRISLRLCRDRKCLSFRQYGKDEYTGWNRRIRNCAFLVGIPLVILAFAYGLLGPK